MNFRDIIVSVKMNKTKIAVVMEKKVFIYNFSDLKLEDSLKTYYNPNGRISKFCINISL